MFAAVERRPQEAVTAFGLLCVYIRKLGSRLAGMALPQTQAAQSAGRDEPCRAPKGCHKLPQLLDPDDTRLHCHRPPPQSTLLSPRVSIQPRLDSFPLM